jgi:hypothetical protein
VISESAWLRSFPQGAGNAGTEITYAQSPRRAEAVGRRHVQTIDCRQPRAERDGRRRMHPAGAARRPHLAAAEGPDGRGAGASALSPATATAGDRRSRPNWAVVHRRLRRPRGGVLPDCFRQRCTRMPRPGYQRWPCSPVISWSTSALKIGNRSAATAASRSEESLAPSKIVSQAPGPEHSGKPT